MCEASEVSIALASLFFGRFFLLLVRVFPIIVIFGCVSDGDSSDGLCEQLLHLRLRGLFLLEEHLEVLQAHLQGQRHARVHTHGQLVEGHVVLVRVAGHLQEVLAQGPQDGQVHRGDHGEQPLQHHQLFGLFLRVVLGSDLLEHLGVLVGEKTLRAAFEKLYDEGGEVSPKEVLGWGFDHRAAVVLSNHFLDLRLRARDAIKSFFAQPMCIKPLQGHSYWLWH